MSKPLILELKEKATKKVLWENTTDFENFESQTVTLNSADYDYLIIYAYRNYGNAETGDARTISLILEKNKSGEIIYTDYYGGSVRVWSRSVTISENQTSFGGNAINGTINNAGLIPYKILGCKY